MGPAGLERKPRLFCRATAVMGVGVVGGPVVAVATPAATVVVPTAALALADGVALALALALAGKELAGADG